MESGDTASSSSATSQTTPRRDFESRKRHVLIEFPGQVENLEKALETLGGRANVFRAMEEKQQHLELKFRRDPASRPIFGDFEVYSGLILRVKVRRSKPNGDKSKRRKTEVVYPRHSVVGFVESAYRFRGLADFQSIPPEGARFLPKPTVGWMKTYDAFAFEDDPVNLPPPIFSKIDMPQTYRFKGSNHAVGDERRSTPRKRIVYVQKVSIKRVGVPTAAEDAADYLREEVEPTHLAEVAALFAERPVWNEAALHTLLPHITAKAISAALTLLTYRFRNGPWRQVYIRLGYDPRKHPESRKYQIIDFRCSEEMTLPTEGQSRWRSADQTPRRRRPAQQNVQKLVELEPSEVGHEKRANLDYTFKAPPQRQQTVYQLCDLDIDAITAVLEEAEQLEKCSNSTGWFAKQTLTRVRDLMDARLPELVKEIEVEAALKKDVEGEIDTP